MPPRPKACVPPSLRPMIRPQASRVAVQNDDYVIGPAFARGTYGSIHRALHVERPCERLVAKKMLVGTSIKQALREAGDFFQRRPAAKIEAEIATMHAVQSPLRPLSAQVGEREATLVMPYCDGDMSAVTAPFCGLPETTRRDMLRSALAQSADELARMHSARYLHLDIKPANIFFTGGGEVCMGDFGMAHRFAPGEPLQLRRGSPAMMAPEALLDRHVTPQAETWSLFVTWLDLAVGTHNNVFVTEPQQRVNRWKAKHGPQFYVAMFKAEDGPFRTFVADLQTWRNAHAGPLDAARLRQESDDPISYTFARALAFDPQMTALGWEHALADRPEDRADMRTFHAGIRALQPVDGDAEALARRAFGRLPAAGSASDVPFAALRREAQAARRERGSHVPLSKPEVNTT